MRYDLVVRETEFEALERRLKQFPRSYRNRVERAGLQAVAAEVATEAQRGADFTDRTGRLRRSIRAARRKVRRRRRKVTLAVTLAGSARAPYAYFVEAVIPYLFPALERAQPRLLRTARRAMIARFGELTRDLKRIR